MRFFPEITPTTDSEQNLFHQRNFQAISDLEAKVSRLEAFMTTPEPGSGAPRKARPVIEYVDAYESETEGQR